MVSLLNIDSTYHSLYSTTCSVLFHISGYFLIGFILSKLSSFPLHPHESITSLRYHELEKTTLFQEDFPKILFSQFCFRSYENKMKYCHQAFVFLQLLYQDILHCGWHSVTCCLFLKLFHVSFHILDQKVFREILFCSFRSPIHAIDPQHMLFCVLFYDLFKFRMSSYKKTQG